MNYGSEDFDSSLARRVTRNVESANLHTQPSAVVASVVGPATSSGRWPRALPIAVAAVVLAIGSVGVFSVLTGGSGSRGSHAEVGGLTYDVVVDSTLTVAPGDLSPYAAITESSDAFAFSELQAYRLEGVDPRALLVVPANPEAEHPVDYLLLIGAVDPYPAACRYHDARAGEVPVKCSVP